MRSIETLKSVEEKQVKEVLEHCRGNRSLAAKELGISVNTLRSKIKKYKIEVKSNRSVVNKILEEHQDNLKGRGVSYEKYLHERIEDFKTRLKANIEYLQFCFKCISLPIISFQHDDFTYQCPNCKDIYVSDISKDEARTKWNHWMKVLVDIKDKES